MNMNLQENIDRIKKNMGIRREYIDWDENYGKTFRIVHTPQSAVDGEWNSDLISVVTPENGESFYTWEEVPFDTLMSWRENWDEIQRSLGDYKYRNTYDSDQPLAWKIEQVLEKLIPAFGLKKNDFNLNVEDNSESDDDY